MRKIKRSGIPLLSVSLLIVILTIVCSFACVCPVTPSSPAPAQPDIVATDPPSVPSTSIPADVRVVEVLQTDSGLEIIGVNTIPAMNCDGPNALRFTASRSRSIVQEITLGAAAGVEVGGSVNVGVAEVIFAHVEVAVTAYLETDYHVTNGEEIEETLAVEVEAQPGQNLEYQVVWSEEWVKGFVIVESTDQTRTAVPFHIARALRGEVITKNIGCDTHN